MKCALCKIGEAVEDSHIIPRFVFRWIKKNGPTGYLRTTREPNRRKQDGWKEKLLCADCEDRFSVFETLFANKVFYPLHLGEITNDSFDYERWLLDFAVSVSWRSLAHSLREGNFREHGQMDIPSMYTALQHWANYLCGKATEIAPFEQHIVILDAPVETTGIQNSLDLSFYMARGVDFNTMHSPMETYIFTKLCRIVIAGTIRNHSPRPNWDGTAIYTQGNYNGKTNKVVSSVLFTFLNTAVNEIREARQQVSQEQCRVMEESFKKKHANTGTSV